MRHGMTGLLSAAAICAFASATPALAGNGSDANAQAEQAQLHPMLPNQTPDWIPNGAPVGEVYAVGPTYYPYAHTYYQAVPVYSPPIVGYMIEAPTIVLSPACDKIAGNYVCTTP